MNGNSWATRKVVSEIFTNLAAGWFGLVLITPAAIPALSFSDLTGKITLSLVYGLGCALIAIELSKEVTV